MFSKIVRVCGGIFFLNFTLKMFAIEFLTFSFFDETGQLMYSEQDVRWRAGLLPFPCIFHYNRGGDTSCRSDFRILDKSQESVQAEMPEKLKSFLETQALVKTQYFEAYCTPLAHCINYFTHPWAMDRMVENRMVLVSSGMYSAQNLSPVGDEIGVDTVVPQYMYFHDGNHLSGNVARFRIEDGSEQAEAWFVSIYDPKDNMKQNAVCNQLKRGIVVHWHFMPITWDYLPEDDATIIDLWDFIDQKPVLQPSFIPQK